MSPLLWVTLYVSAGIAMAEFARWAHSVRPDIAKEVSAEMYFALTLLWLPAVAVVVARSLPWVTWLLAAVLAAVVISS